MIRHARGVAAHLRAEKADVCIPRRDDAMFRRTYPIEQYHSERFANAHLDALARPHGLPAGIDWTFGPVALRAALAPCWLRCDGELWDAQVRFRPTSAQPHCLARAHRAPPRPHAQIVPFVRAARWEGASIVSHSVSYEHPPLMKEEEEGVPRWSEKRLEQLNFLFRYVGDALRETGPPS